MGGSGGGRDAGGRKPGRGGISGVRIGSQRDKEDGEPMFEGVEACEELGVRLRDCMRFFSKFIARSAAGLSEKSRMLTGSSSQSNPRPVGELLTEGSTGGFRYDEAAGGDNENSCSPGTLPPAEEPLKSPRLTPSGRVSMLDKSRDAWRDSDSFVKLEVGVEAVAAKAFVGAPGHFEGGFD